MRHYQQSLATGLIGILIGACIMVVYQGRQLETLNMQLTTLTHEHDDLIEQNHLLSMKLEQSDTEPMIEKIKVDAKAPDAVSQVEVVQWVKEQLKFVMGRPVKRLADIPDLPFKTLDGHIIEVQQQKLVIHVLTVAVASTLYVQVSAEATD